MMENYDRTVELVETAYDSAGKSSEQFAKYQDTIEYKITQLKNTWEQMRTTFFNSEMFKGVIDGLNALLKKVQDFSAVDIVSLAAVWVTFGRLMITNMIKGIQSSATLLSTGLSNVISKASTSIKGFLNTRLNLSIGAKTDKLKEDIKEAEQKIKDAEKRIEENKIVIDVDTQQALDKIDELENKINSGDFSSDEERTQAKNELDELKKKKKTIDGANERRRQAEQDRDNAQRILDSATGDQEALQKKVEARGEFIGQTLATSITMAMTAVATSDNPMEAFGQVMLTGLAAMIPSLISMATAAGGSLSAGFIIGTAGIGALILGIVGAITAAIVYIKGAFDEAEANKFENRFKAAKQAADDAKQAAEEAANTAKEAQETFESTEDLKKRFTELNEKQMLTTEEQEEYNELVKQIQDEFPQVISYYNEATGELRTQNDLWEEIVEKQRIASEYAVKNSFLAANASVAADTNLKRYELVEDYSTKTGLSQTGVEDYLDSKATAGEYATAIASDIGNAKYYSDITLDIDVDKLGELYGIDLDTYVDEAGSTLDSEALNDLSDAIEADDQRLIEALESAKQSNEDLINKEYEMIASNFGDVLTAIDPEMGEGEKRLREKIGQTAIESEGLTAMTLEEYKQAVENKNGNFARNNNFFDAMHGKKSGASSNDFGDLDELTKENGIEIEDNGILSSYGIKTQKDAANFFIRSYGTDTAEAYKQWAEWQDNEAGQMKIFERIVNQALEEKMEAANKALELSDVQTEQLEQIYQDAMEEGVTQDELNKMENYLISLLGDGNENVINNFMEDLQTTYDEASEKIKNMGLNKNQTEGWSTDQMSQYVSYIESMSTVAGEKAANNFGQEMLSEFEGLGLETDQLLTAFSSVDWSAVTLGNLNEIKKQFVSMMEESMGESFDAEKVDQLWEKFFAAADKYNVVDLSISTEGGLDSIINSLSDTWTTNIKEFSGISNIITEQLTDGFISFSSSQDVTEAITNMGLKADDYLKYQESGQIQFKTEELITDLLESQDMTAEALLKKAREETEEKLQRIRAEKALLLAGQGQVDQATTLIKEHSIDLTLLDQMANLMATMGQIEYSGMSINIGEMVAEADEAQKAMAQTRIEELTEQEELLNDFLNKELVEGSETYKKLTAQEQSYRNELGKIYSNSAKDAQKAQSSTKDSTEDLTKAQKEYDEALHGTAEWLDKQDPFKALTESASLLEKQLDSLKKKMEDITTPSEGKDVLSAITQNRSSQIENLMAQQRAAQDQLSQLQNFYKNSDYSQFFSEMPDGTMAFDISKWANQGGSDEMGDWLLDMASKGTEAQEKILDTQQKINDIYDEQEKEHEERVKNYASLQEKIIDILKEQAKEEVDTQKEKYEALKEEDDNYLDALKEAIDKQRQLREQESQYQDLATKEKKLALMQRDTSGVNQKEIQSLESEIEEERQNLLDSKVDEILDDLSKNYELQAEMRDLEIEQKEIALEEKNYLAELASVESGFHNQEDVVAWMIENDKEWKNYTIEQQEQKIMEWEELGTSWATYLAEKEQGYSDLLTTSEENIQQYAQIAADAVEGSIERIKNSEEQAQKEREDEARKALEESRKNYNEALGQYGNFVQNLANVTPGGNGDNKNENGKNKNNKDENGKYRNNKNEKTLTGPAASEAYKTIKKEIIDKEKERGLSKLKGPAASEAYKTLKNELLDKYSNNKDIVEEAWNSVRSSPYWNKKETWKEYADSMQATNIRKNIDSFTDLDKGLWGISFSENANIQWYTNSEDEVKKAKDAGMYVLKYHPDEFEPDKMWTPYATGGLVNYTGPAWVDGTPNKPEAFLSADDTVRIGEAAKLLAQLPIFNSPSSETPISSNVGDTSIEIHINVENLSSDYDVDQMIERVKKDIVDVSKPIGSSVILSK